MRLIDAERLDWWYKGRPIRRVIDEAPTVDAVEVVHGKWRLIDFGGNVECSVCREISDEEYNYCPYCGAKMDGEKK